MQAWICPLNSKGLHAAVFLRERAWRTQLKGFQEMVGEGRGQPEWAVKMCKMQGLIPFLWLHPLLNSTRLRIVYRQPQCHTQEIENFLRLSFNICFRLKGKKTGSWTILQGFRKVKSYAHAHFKWKRRKPGPKFSSPFHYTKFFFYLSICSLFIY